MSCMLTCTIISFSCSIPIGQILGLPLDLVGMVVWFAFFTQELHANCRIGFSSPWLIPRQVDDIHGFWSRSHACNSPTPCFYISSFLISHFLFPCSFIYQYPNTRCKCVCCHVNMRLSLLRVHVFHVLLPCVNNVRLSSEKTVVATCINMFVNLYQCIYPWKQTHVTCKLFVSADKLV